jgi:hypothetical protein
MDIMFVLCMYCVSLLTTVIPIGGVAVAWWYSALLFSFFVGCVFFCLLHSITYSKVCITLTAIPVVAWTITLS